MEGMSNEELRHQILDFLRDFKELMGQGQCIVRDHLKNLQALNDLGFTVRMRDEILLSIELQDYSSGPTPDEMHPGDYWIFGSAIDSNEIYIKLKIVAYNNGSEKAVCISFHPSEGPLKHPFRT